MVFAWRDGFTGRRYNFTAKQQDAARRLVAGLLGEELKAAGTDLRALADAAATFWAKKYYRLIFPLAFSREMADDGVRTVFLDTLGGRGERPEQAAAFRQAPLDGSLLPRSKRTQRSTTPIFSRP